MKNKSCTQQSCAKKTSIGGQALIEGIMMRGPKHSAMAVRNPEGEIVLEKWENKLSKKPKVFKMPVIRGVFNFIDSMKEGYKCLMRSAEIAGLEDEQPKEQKQEAPVEDTPIIEEDTVLENTEENMATESAEVSEEATEEQAQSEEAVVVDAEVKQEEKTDKAEEKKSDSSALMAGIMVVASVLGVVLAVFLFILLPTYIFKWSTELFPALKPHDKVEASLIKSVFEGLLRIVIIVVYMLSVTLMKDIRRTFQYHGAEHKTIFCYENGLELTVENVRKQRRFHPRCGTSFLILMLLVGIFVSFFIDPLFIALTGGVPSALVRSFVKILLLPITMGIGYELIKLAGKHQNIVTRIISAPGMWLQRITVLEPTDDMIECAIKAFVEVIPEEEK